MIRKRPHGKEIADHRWAYTAGMVSRLGDVIRLFDPSRLGEV
jgi:hypothetical protein